MNDQDVIMIERCLGWQGLADALAKGLSSNPCDHTTLTLTEMILKPLKVWESMSGWLEANGLVCDCNVHRWAAWIAMQRHLC